MMTASKIPALVCCLVSALVAADDTFGQFGPSDTPGMPDLTMSQGSREPPPFNEYFGSVQAPDRFVCFPPTAPTFGAPIANRQSGLSVNGVRYVTPDVLADFANENFYPALSIRLFDNYLSPQHLARLRTYQAARTTLINELKAQLSLTAAADPATRERELHAFAVVQTPRIVALEKEAEQLRDDLVNGSWFQLTVNWNKMRDWTLGTLPTRDPSLVADAEFQVIRAAVYFQRGLSVEQRGLLREVAMAQGDQLRSTAWDLRPASAGTNDSHTLFFSPETSRLNVPLKLPPALSDKIGIYYHDKVELSNELRDAVVAQDQNFAVTRTKNFEALAIRQAPRLTALAELAEEIRRGLAALPPPPPPAAPPDLSPELIARINALRHDMRALADERSAFLLHATVVPFKFDLSQPPMELGGQLDTLRIAAINRTDDEFRQEAAGRYAELKQRAAAIRESLIAETDGHIDPSTGKPMDATTLVRTFEAAQKQFDQLGREEATYGDYQIAMLQPGLSPEQRRLLFGAELVALAQPLPAPQRISPQFRPSF